MSERLPGLDGLRALAALIVLLWHVDRFCSPFGLRPVGYSANSAAHSAVVFFFVLSGYLITLLLLRGGGVGGSVGLRLFYRRRAVRILPPYILALLWSTVLLHFEGVSLWEFWDRYLLYLLLLPNVAAAFGLGFICLYPLWSVGVEIQFYTFWAWLMSRVSRQSLPKVMSGIFCGYVLVKLFFRVFAGPQWYQLVRLTSLSSLMVGAFAGWLVFSNHPLLTRVLSRRVEVFCWLFVTYGVLVSPLQVTSMLAAETQAPVYACLILNLSRAENVLIPLENCVVKFLGRISYGLYVYHLPVIFTIGPWYRRLNLGLAPNWASVLTNALTLSVAVCVATASFYLLEKPLLTKTKVKKSLP